MTNTNAFSPHRTETPLSKPEALTFFFDGKCV